MKFAVETIDSGRAAFITDDSSSVRIEVTAPSDLQHAWRVATYLTENVKGVAVADRDRGMTPLGDAYASR